MLDILKTGQNHINLIGAFIAYARLRLTGEQINLFVNSNKALRASEVLKIASIATVKEVKDALEEVGNFERYISAVYEFQFFRIKNYLNLLFKLIFFTFKFLLL